MDNSKKNGIHILMAEDDAHDVEFTIEALKMSKLFHDVSVVTDGDQVIPFLDDHSNSLPDLILLDLNMPKVSGLEALDLLKQHPTYRKIPVVILTSSNSDEDVLNSYKKYANCYVRKPVGQQQFQSTVQAIEDFWFSIVVLPND